MDIVLANKKIAQPGVATYQWATPGSVIWQAGQYGVFYLDHPNWDSKGPERKFSISSAPQESLAFTTRTSDSSFKRALEQLEIGQTIQLKNIGGQFTVDSRVHLPLIFIAGGIGITPLRAILSDLVKKGNDTLVHLLYINSDNNFVFRDELDNLSARYPNITIEYLIGRQSLSTDILQGMPNIASSKVFVSGPTPFLDHIESRLQEIGIDEGSIEFDDFEEDWPS